MTWTECKIPKKIDLTGLYSALERKFIKSYSFSGESHDFYEIIFMTEGSALITAGSRLFKLYAGECFVHLPNEFHKVSSNNEPFSFLVLSFGARAFPDFSDRSFLISAYQIQELQKIVRDIGRTFRMDRHLVLSDNGVAFASQILLSRIELLLYQIFSNDTVTKCTIEESAKSKNYTLISEYLSENICRNIGIEEISRHCSMSTSSVFKTFKHFSGLSPLQYHTMLRIDKAKKLLLSGKNVCTVAEELGFNSASHFSVYFKKNTGLSPLDYKRK